MRCFLGLQEKRLLPDSSPGLTQPVSRTRIRPIRRIGSAAIAASSFARPSKSRSGETGEQLLPRGLPGDPYPGEGHGLQDEPVSVMMAADSHWGLFVR